MNTKNNEARIEIRKPSRGAFGEASNFTQGCAPWVSAESLAKKERELWIDGELAGALVKENGSWWVSCDGYKTFELASRGGLRSDHRARLNIADQLGTQEGDPLGFTAVYLSDEVMLKLLGINKMERVQQEAREGNELRPVPAAADVPAAEYTDEDGREVFDSDGIVFDAVTGNELRPVPAAADVDADGFDWEPGPSHGAYLQKLRDESRARSTADVDADGFDWEPGPRSRVPLRAVPVPAAADVSAAGNDGTLTLTLTSAEVTLLRSATQALYAKLSRDAADEARTPKTASTCHLWCCRNEDDAADEALASVDALLAECEPD